MFSAATTTIYTFSLFLLSFAQTESHTTSLIPSLGQATTTNTPSPTQTFVGYAPYGNSTCVLRCTYGADDCSMIDTRCLCTNPMYQNSVEGCMAINCNGEQRSAQAIYYTFCQPVLHALASSSSSSNTPNSQVSISSSPLIIFPPILLTLLSFIWTLVI